MLIVLSYFSFISLSITHTHTHSLWLSTVKASVDVEGPRLSLELSMVSAELWEYLYRNQAMINHITKPVSVSPVCTWCNIFFSFPVP